MRPSALTNRHTRKMYAHRELVWKSVGKWGVGAKYAGSVPLRTQTFDGSLEAFEWIQGRSLRPTLDAAHVARTLATLHSQPISSLQKFFPVTPFVPFVQSQLREYQRLNRTDGEIEEVLARESMRALETLKHLPIKTRRVALVHNDLVDANVLYADDRIWLIDWDWALFTAPSVDIYCYLSPFVRSWGRRPRFLDPQTSTDFLSTYFGSGLVRRSMRRLGHEAELWQPYNALVANWLHHDALRLPHLRRTSFYSDSFKNVDRLAEVLAAFK